MSPKPLSVSQRAAQVAQSTKGQGGEAYPPASYARRDDTSAQISIKASADEIATFRELCRLHRRQYGEMLRIANRLIEKNLTPPEDTF